MACTDTSAHDDSAPIIDGWQKKSLGFGIQALYGGLYTEQNVAISGIHTHSGPGGYLQFVLYDITSLGFVPQSYDALVYGILEVTFWSSGGGGQAPEADL